MKQVIKWRKPRSSTIFHSLIITFVGCPKVEKRTAYSIFIRMSGARLVNYILIQLMWLKYPTNFLIQLTTYPVYPYRFVWETKMQQNSFGRLMNGGRHIIKSLTNYATFISFILFTQPTHQNKMDNFRWIYVFSSFPINIYSSCNLQPFIFGGKQHSPIEMYSFIQFIYTHTHTEHNHLHTSARKIHGTQDTLKRQQNLFGHIYIRLYTAIVYIRRIASTKRIHGR